ncbi:hypothetical protein [Variovorax rhizosphaerae]|uniref:Photosynthesis system II assembly factor Ycf48/Hcf136-like domain-containing protein n=1 Tax=Variovorax rhizosphaerae TaxID=1836200 RepID=A0ABU8WGG0_9BURK
MSYAIVSRYRAFLLRSLLAMLAAAVMFPSARGGPLDHWTVTPAPPPPHSTQPASTSNNKGIAFGNGQFVIFGEGETHSSTDGIHWTTEFTNTCHHGVAFGNGRFVAVGADTRTSTTGSGWTNIRPQIYSGSTIWLRAIAFGEHKGRSLFIAVGDTGQILTSSNGIAWTKRNPGAIVPNPQPYLQAVAYGKGRFVAVGDNSTIITSDNGGFTWTQRGIGTVNGTFAGVAYGNNKFVVVDAGALFESADGTTWSAPIPVTGMKLSGIGYTDLPPKTFVAVGLTTGTVAHPPSAILASINGGPWTLKPAPTFTELRDVEYGLNMLVAVGQGGAILHSDKIPPPGKPPCIPSSRKPFGCK